MQSTICFIFIVLAVSTCRAKVNIIQGNDISIEFDKPLEITFTNDKTSDVEFRHQQSVVAYCLGKHGCNIDDERFNITPHTSAGRNEYILTSNGAIQTALCGVYECNDLLYSEKDSAEVSIIGFDTEKYNATEEKDTIYLTTECTFHVSLSDMQIVWYTYDNTTLELLDVTRMGHLMTPFSNASVCSDECGTLSAYKFTFGLNIIDEEQGSTDVFIETNIFHPDYMNKPLTWRSLNTFRVKESSPKTPTSVVLMAVIVLVSVCVTVSIAGAIYGLIRSQRKTNTETHINPANEKQKGLVISELKERQKHQHRGERKLSQSEGSIDACVRVHGETRHQLRDRWKHTHFFKEASQVTKCLLVSELTERFKHQHRGERKLSQSEHSIDTWYRDQGEKKHLRDTGKHRQSEAAIYPFVEEIAQRYYTET